MEIPNYYGLTEVEKSLIGVTHREMRELAAEVKAESEEETKEEKNELQNSNL